MLAGKLEAVIPPVLAETYYVAARVYAASGAPDPERRAGQLVGWPATLLAVKVVEGAKLTVEAGSLKLGLVLTDCHVLAAAKLAGGRAAFRSGEAEMSRWLSS